MSNKDQQSADPITAEAENALLQGPIHVLDTDAGRQLDEGSALCLSGGGYRAMLFHTGVLWRLNEIGRLTKLKRISSVSGGSITAAVLAMKWGKFNMAHGFEEEVVLPIRELASRTIDIPSILKGICWFGSIGDNVANAYRRRLFGNSTLQDIPSDAPLFVFNATNVSSGVLWRFTKPYMWDYRVGKIEDPTVDLAVAVAASSAFPPFLSPVALHRSPGDFVPDSGTDLQDDDYRRTIVLTDGGVYDNLGLETVWKNFKTVLVSDAGGSFEAESKPVFDWFRHTYRILNTIDNQVRSLRKRQVVESYKAKVRSGSYWSIRTNADEDYEIASNLECPFEVTSRLAAIPTRLARLTPTTQEQLINWGYALSDRAIRKYIDKTVPAATRFPYPKTGLHK
jgi:NTE family protein